MATISNIVVEISAKTQKLQQGIRKASSMVAGFAKQAAKVGVAISAAIAGVAVTAFVRLSNAIARTADELDSTIKTASKLGVAVSELQFLQFAAEQTGVSTQQLATGLQRMTRRVAEAAQGTGAAKKALQELNLNASSLNQLSPDKQFEAIAKALNNVANQGDKVRLTMQIFDTEGVGLVNTFGANLEQLRGQFNDLGLAITQQQAKQIEAYNKARNRLSKIWDSFFVQLTAQSAGAFTKVIEWIEATIKKFGGMKGAAKVASDFIISGLLAVVTAAEGVVSAITAITDSIAELSSGNAARRLALLFSTVDKFFTKKYKLEFDKDGNLKKTLTEEFKLIEQTQDLLAKDIVSTESEIAKRGATRKKFFAGIKDSIKELRKELNTPQSFIPSISDLLKKNATANQASTAKKALEKNTQEQKKTNKEADKYKNKLKLVNMELQRANLLIGELRKQQGAAASSGTFSQGIGALSDLLARANDPSKSTFERNDQRKLFERARLQFAGSGTTAQVQQQQRLEVVITADESGIITPVVKSDQLNQEVVTIIRRTINQSSRINDR